MRHSGLLLTLILLGFVQYTTAQLSDDEDVVAIHGFISQGYMQTSANNFFGDTEDGTFKYNEFGINIASQVTDNLHIGMQLFSRNLGYLGGNAVVIDWAYGDYRWKDWLGIRAGKIKMPLGFYNETRDVDMLRTNIFLPQGVYNESWRTVFNAIQGLGLYGNVSIPYFGTLNYQAQIGVFNIRPETGLNKFIEDQLYTTFSQYFISTTYVGSIIWETPLEGLRLGASGFMSDLYANGTTDNTDFWKDMTAYAFWLGSGQITPAPPTYEVASQFIDLVGIDIRQEFNNIKTYWLSAEYVWDRLTLSGEYFKQIGDVVTFGMIDYKDPSLAPENGGYEKLNSINLDMGGFYASINYQFTDWLDVGTYYTEYYPDYGDKDGKAYEELYGFPASNSWYKDWTLSFKFNINSNWIAKIEGHKINGTAIMYRSDQVDPYNVAEDWYLFAGKLTYNF
jgi:hypothetical protein